jgi:drug/metabolite transporter (DMT)-like permease
VPPELYDLADQVSLTPGEWIGIPIALVGAVFLSLGAHFQHKGVGLVQPGAEKMGTDKLGTSKLGTAKLGTAKLDLEESGSSALSLNQIMRLLARPSWVLGTALLGLAILFQLTSLYFSPLIVVQPLGALALVVTAFLTARVSGISLDAKSVRAITFCVVGIGMFVAIAALTAKSSPITETQLIVVLIILGVALTVFGVIFGVFKARIRPMFYIVGAGVLFGFVATLAKVVIGRIQTLVQLGFESSGVEWLTIACVVALLAATALGSYFVQTAYASGPPDLVVAGLTVIDPIVAISVGIIVLGEAAEAPLWAIISFIIAGALAVYGVFQLAQHHPGAAAKIR